jgi:hypothetical protein
MNRESGYTVLCSFDEAVQRLIKARSSSAAYSIIRN